MVSAQTHHGQEMRFKKQNLCTDQWKISAMISKGRQESTGQKIKLQQWVKAKLHYCCYSMEPLAMGGCRRKQQQHKNQLQNSKPTSLLMPPKPPSYATINRSTTNTRTNFNSKTTII